MQNTDAWPDAPLLIIDDDEQWLLVLRQALAGLGWNRVHTLSDPSHAVQLAAEFEPALVLLDLVMAAKDGRQVLGELRAAHAELPIIIITGVNRVETVAECMRDGATNYLTKPLLREKLRNALVDALARTSGGARVPSSGGVRRMVDIMPTLDELPTLKEMPELLIEEALRRSDGVIKEAASMLGISSQAICNRRRRSQQRATPD